MTNLFVWAEYNELAIALIDDPYLNAPVVACYRAAISRAYYAAFRTAHEQLKGYGVYVDESEGSHVGVIQAFLHSSVPERQEIGALLNLLKTYRVAADYYSEPVDRFGVGHGDAEFCVTEVTKALGLLKQSGSLPRPWY